jgi:hypothetical protein
MKPRIDWAAQPLGQIPDTELARRLGCSHQAVHDARRRRRIPAAVSRQRTGIDWERQPLGQVPDAALAAALHVRVSAVTNARARRKIPGFQASKRQRIAELLTRERLELLHGRYELSSFRIAEMLNVEQKLVWQALRRFGIQRSHADAMRSERTRARIREALARRRIEREAAE